MLCEGSSRGGRGAGLIAGARVRIELCVAGSCGVIGGHDVAA